MKPHVIIYSRPGCHLCDEAKAAIQNAGCDDQFTLEEINIESDNELLRKYKYDIPVITIDGHRSLHPPPHAPRVQTKALSHKKAQKSQRMNHCRLALTPKCFLSCCTNT